MKGVVLAAGLGTRLYPVTREIAKPLLPIANRMTLEYAFDQLKECGITDVCVVVGEMEEQMRAELGDGSRFGVSLSFVRQTEPQGLAHAVGFAKEFVGDDDFLLYLGDAIYGQSLAPFVDQYRQSGAANLNLVRHVDDPRRFGVANVEDGRIVKLVEKPEHPESNWAMAGMYIFGPQLWSVLPRLERGRGDEYQITDAIQMMIDEGELVVPGVFEGDWFDTGTRESFLFASRSMAGDEPLVDSSAAVRADLQGHVVIGANAAVRATRIVNSVILPGATVEVEGEIVDSIVGGNVHAESLESAIRFGELDK